MVEAKFGRIDLRLGHRARFTRPRGGSLKWLHPVSRLGGREGESFSSPEVQRKKISAWADAPDVSIVQR
jgi:hypothetical protein